MQQPTIETGHLPCSLSQRMRCGPRQSLAFNIAAVDTNAAAANAETRPSLHFRLHNMHVCLVCLQPHRLCNKPCILRAASHTHCGDLQATVTKAVLPLWSYNKLPKCSFRITRQVINILTDCTTGTAAATAVLNRASAVIRPAAQPDPAMVQTIVDMGFTRARVEQTLQRVCYSQFPKQ